MKKSVTALAGLVALAGLGMASTAPAAEGIYIGGAALQSRFDSDNFDVDDVDDEDTGWKLMLGIRPVPHFAIEGAYTKFGEASAPAVGLGDPFETEAEAWSAFGVGILPVGPVELFLKAGAARIESTSTDIGLEDDEIEFAYGAGVQFALGKLGLRAEYEKFDTEFIGDLDVISVGVTFTFGG